MLAANKVPLVALILIGGVWADRLPRHRVMVATDLVRFALHGLLAALIFAGIVHIWELIAIEALFGIQGLGNLVLSAGSDYEVTVTNTVSSAVALTGTSTASLAGILSVDAVGISTNYSASDTYNVLTTAASSGVSGTFSGITVASGSFGNFVPYLTYPNNNSVQLDLTAGNQWIGGTTAWNTTGNWTSGIVPSGSPASTQSSTRRSTRPSPASTE